MLLTARDPWEASGVHQTELQGVRTNLTMIQLLCSKWATVAHSLEHLPGDNPTSPFDKMHEGTTEGKHFHNYSAWFLPFAQF